MGGRNLARREKGGNLVKQMEEEISPALFMFFFVGRCEEGASCVFVLKY